jgi:hypothetical protein
MSIITRGTRAAYSGVKRAGRAIRIALRAARIVARHPALPWPLRALFIAGLIQVPVLPADEIALAIALLWLVIGYRPVLREALKSAARDN